MKSKISIMGTIVLILGIICFIIRSFIPTTVASDGTLIDYFYLVGIGYILIFIGIIFIVIGFIKNKSKKK